MVKIYNSFRDSKDSLHSLQNKALIADDDACNIDILNGFSNQLGVECLSAKNGPEAVEIFEKNSDDIGIVPLDYACYEWLGSVTKLDAESNKNIV